MTKFTGRMCKVRSMTLDTNVISDIPALSYFEHVLESGGLPENEQEYFHRCRASKKAIFVMLDFDIERIGLKMVFKELLESPPLHMLYKDIFPQDARQSREAASLAGKYMDRLQLPLVDATITALASANRIDVLLSWNRHHVANPAILEKIEEINSASGFPTPEIITPREFLDRVIRSDKRTIALSPVQLRPLYRVDSYLSKRGL